MSWGSLTGCVEGQGPPDSKEPDVGYATCSLWLSHVSIRPSHEKCLHTLVNRRSSHPSTYTPSALPPPRPKIYLRRKRNRRPNPPSTLPLRQIIRIRPRARRPTEWILLLVAEAPVAQLLLLAVFGAQARVPDEHAEAFRKRSYLSFSVVRRDVVHCDALAAGQSQVNHLRHALVGTVARAEVQVCGPVVAEVLGVVAGCAGGCCGGVKCEGCHGCVEGVAADDLGVGC